MIGLTACRPPRRRCNQRSAARQTDKGTGRAVGGTHRAAHAAAALGLVDVAGPGRRLDAAQAVEVSGLGALGIEDEERDEADDLEDEAEDDAHAREEAEPAQGRHDGGGADEEGQGVGRRGDQDGDRAALHRRGGAVLHGRVAAQRRGRPHELARQYEGIVDACSLEQIRSSTQLFSTILNCTELL